MIAIVLDDPAIVQLHSDKHKGFLRLQELLSYLDQLKKLAEIKGVSLKEAVSHAGIADSTFYRWQKGSYEPRFATAKAIADVISSFPDASRT